MAFMASLREQFVRMREQTLRTTLHDEIGKAPLRVRVRIDRERLAHWRGKGARLSDTAARLVKQFGEQKAA